MFNLIRCRRLAGQFGSQPRRRAGFYRYPLRVVPASDADHLSVITKTATRLRNLGGEEQGFLYVRPGYNCAVPDTLSARVYDENLPTPQGLEK